MNKWTPLLVMATVENGQAMDQADTLNVLNEAGSIWHFNCVSETMDRLLEDNAKWGAAR